MAVQRNKELPEQVCAPVVVSSDYNRGFAAASVSLYSNQELHPRFHGGLAAPEQLPDPLLARDQNSEPDFPVPVAGMALSLLAFDLPKTKKNY